MGRPIAVSRKAREYIIDRLREKGIGHSLAGIVFIREVTAMQAPLQPGERPLTPKEQELYDQGGWEPYVSPFSGITFFRRTRILSPEESRLAKLRLLELNQEAARKRILSEIK